MNFLCRIELFFSYLFFIAGCYEAVFTYDLPRATVSLLMGLMFWNFSKSDYP